MHLVAFLSIDQLILKIPRGNVFAIYDHQFLPKTPEENSPASPLHSDHDSAGIVGYITGI